MLFIKKWKKKYYALSVIEKRNLCYQFALNNIEIQKKQFAQFGLLTDYTKFYCTLTKDYEKRQLELFIEMIKKGLIYQAFKPVYWSWSSQTALAEAEIEYKDLISPSIYVKFYQLWKIFVKLPYSGNSGWDDSLR